jgi:hypothetical protein
MQILLNQFRAMTRRRSTGIPVKAMLGARLTHIQISASAVVLASLALRVMTSE